MATTAAPTYGTRSAIQDRALPASRTDAALAVLRVIAGIVFAAHGAQKLFVYGFAGVTGAFAQMGAPFPELTGPLVALVEFLGGLALVVGLLTRLAGLGLAITMLGAIVLVHLAGGFFLPNGVEFALTLLAVAVTFVIAGPGRYSLDHAIAARRAR